MSLVELMIAVSILTVGIMGFISSFEYISKSIHISRARTLAVNLAQEKMENLKNIPYYKVQLTTDAYINTNFTPSLRYDKVSYPPEEIVIGGVTFTRAVSVSLAEVEDGSIESKSWDYPDTGMKYITVYVMWRQLGKWRYLDLDNIYENPTVDPLNSTIKGDVLSGGSPVPNAVVRVLENPDWNDFVGADGSYTILAQAGTYSIRVTSAGYFDATANNVSVATGASATQDFTLTKIATGSVSGYAWINSGLVISQIAASTFTRLGGLDPAPVDVEYVELFNPTTFNINIGDNATGEKYVKLDYDCETGGSKADASDAVINLQYVSTFVPVGHYYLIASTESFYIDGRLVHADAKYGTENADHIGYNDAGCLKISDAATGNAIDVVGWDDNSSGHTAPCYEGGPIPDEESDLGICPDGIGRGNQVVRVSTPPFRTDHSQGSAYDSGNNNLDFIYPELMCPTIPKVTGFWFHYPRTVADGPMTVISGKPAIESGVMVDDLIGKSTTTQTFYHEYNGLQVPVATFTLVGVATGTWNVIVASVPYLAELSNVVVTENATTVVPNAVTVPAGDPYNGLILSSSTLDGYVGGVVTDNTGNNLADIQVRAGGVTKTTNAQGLYVARVSSGIVNITANPNNQNPTYSQSVTFQTLESGQLVLQDFTLSLAGVLQGFITTDGNSILPNITVSATRGGYEYGTATSDSSGIFYLRNLSTGTYTVKPVVDPLETYSPASISATVSSTQAVHIGTFTIAGAYGTLSGNLTFNGAKLTSGALILVSTKTLAATPPSIVASSSPAQAVIYAASSKADGTFEVEVRGSTITTFNVSAYIPVLGASSVSVTTKTYSGITIHPQQETTLTITAP